MPRFILPFAILALALAGCADKDVERFSTINTTQHPILPDLVLPPVPSLVPYTWALPTGEDGTVPANLRGSLCLSPENFSVQRLNEARLKEYTDQLKARILLVNEQRRKDREDNVSPVVEAVSK